MVSSYGADVVVGEVEQPQMSEAPETVLSYRGDVGPGDVHLLQVGQRGEYWSDRQHPGLVFF